MTARSLQIISIVATLVVGRLASAAVLEPGRPYSFSLHDVDGNELSTADGHITILTVVTRQNEAQAHAVADLVPDRCLGDPKYRYITLVNFQRGVARPFQGLTRTIIRKRLDAEAKELQRDYTAKKLTRDPRRDIFVIADFDGTAVRQVGLTPENSSVAVFVFDQRGKLINRWDGVPPGNSLPDAVAAAERS